MMILLWILTIAAIAGSVAFLVIEHLSEKWSETVPPWAEATPGIDLHFDGGFGRRS